MENGREMVQIRGAQRRVKTLDVTFQALLSLPLTTTITTYLWAHAPNAWRGASLRLLGNAKRVKNHS